MYSVLFFKESIGGYNACFYVLCLFVFCLFLQIVYRWRRNLPENFFACVIVLWLFVYHLFAICSVLRHVLAGIKSNRLLVHFHIKSLSIVCFWISLPRQYFNFDSNYYIICSIGLIKWHNHSTRFFIRSLQQISNKTIAAECLNRFDYKFNFKIVIYIRILCNILIIHSNGRLLWKLNYVYIITNKRYIEIEITFIIDFQNSPFVVRTIQQLLDCSFSKDVVL